MKKAPVQKNLAFYSNSLVAMLALVLFSCAAANTHTQKGYLQNPVLNRNFPDPTVIQAAGKYYAYATNSEVAGKMINIQVASSGDLQHWQAEGDALPQKPHWASTTQAFWAPHVLYDTSINQYVLFYSAKSDDTAYDKCLGVAFADNPAGPFRDKGSPLLCGKGFVNIDPMAFIDPQTGKKLLFWGSGFEPIKVQEMNRGWTHFVAGTQPQAVAHPGGEKVYTSLLEGAWVDYADSAFYLYYSGDNCCGAGANYAVMVAKANNATGPYVSMGRAKGTGSSVVLQKDSTWLAPGHNSIFRDHKGQVWMAYHAIDDAQRKKGTGNGSRVMLISPVQYRNGWPEVIKNK